MIHDDDHDQAYERAREDQLLRRSQSRCHVCDLAGELERAVVAPRAGGTALVCVDGEACARRANALRLPPRQRLGVVEEEGVTP